MIEDWVPSWYGSIIVEDGRRPTYQEYTAKGGKGSMMEFYSLGLDPSVNAVYKAHEVKTPTFTSQKRESSVSEQFRSHDMTETQNKVNTLQTDLFKLDLKKETKISELNNLNAKLIEPLKEGITQDIDTTVPAPDIEIEEGFFERIKNEFQVFFASSVVTFLVFLIVQWYPTYVINGLNESFRQPNLPIEEIWRIQGVLEWWNFALITIVKPVSTLLFATSMILAGYFTIHILREIQLAN